MGERVFTDHRPTIEKLVNALKDAPFGSEYSYDKLSILAETNDVRFPPHILQEAKRRLLDCDRLLVNIRGVGYKICEPEKMVDHSTRQRLAGKKRIQQAYRITRAVDLAKLSPTEQSRLINEQGKNAAMLVCFEAVDDKKRLKANDSISVPTHSQIIRILKNEMT